MGERTIVEGAVHLAVLVVPCLLYVTDGPDIILLVAAVLVRGIEDDGVVIIISGVDTVRVDKRKVLLLAEHVQHSVGETIVRIGPSVIQIGLKPVGVHGGGGRFSCLEHGLAVCVRHARRESGVADIAYQTAEQDQKNKYIGNNTEIQTFK